MNQQSLLIYDAHGALKHIQRYVIFFGNKLTGSTQLPACSKFEIICRRRYIILSIMTSDVFIPKEVVKFKKSNTNIGTETCFSFKYIQLCHRNVCIIYILCALVNSYEQWDEFSAVLSGEQHKRLWRTRIFPVLTNFIFRSHSFQLDFHLY